MAKELWVHMVAGSGYRTAIGEAIMQWAFFEPEFDTLLHQARLSNEAAQLSDIVPYPFKRRRKLLLDSARIAFAACPDFVHRVEHFCSDVAAAKKRRDHIAHCRWSGGEEDGKLGSYVWNGNRYIDIEIDAEWLNELAADISHLTARCMAMTHPNTFPGVNGVGLTQPEKDFLRDFRSRNSPKLPTPGLNARLLGSSQA